MEYANPRMSSPPMEQPIYKIKSFISKPSFRSPSTLSTWRCEEKKTNEHDKWLVMYETASYLKGINSISCLFYLIWSEIAWSVHIEEWDHDRFSDGIEENIRLVEEHSLQIEHDIQSNTADWFNEHVCLIPLIRLLDISINVQNSDSFVHWWIGVEHMSLRVEDGSLLDGCQVNRIVVHIGVEL